jgi:hypothetical protein
MQIMATEKVGVYRKYHGPIPTDAAGNPLAKSEWPSKRKCCWVARWFGTNGNRHSRSFDTRKEAERFAETKQAEVRQGNGDPPKGCTIREFWKEHRKLMKDTVRDSTLHMQLTTMAMLANQIGWDGDLRRVTSKDIESYRSTRLEDGIGTATANKEVKLLRRLFQLAILRRHVSLNPCVGVALTKVGRKRVPYCSPEKFHTDHVRGREMRVRIGAWFLHHAALLPLSAAGSLTGEAVTPRATSYGAATAPSKGPCPVWCEMCSNTFAASDSVASGEYGGSGSVPSNWSRMKTFTSACVCSFSVHCFMDASSEVSRVFGGRERFWAREKDLGSSRPAGTPYSPATSPARPRAFLASCSSRR